MSHPEYVHEIHITEHEITPYRGILQKFYRLLECETQQLITYIGDLTEIEGSDDEDLKNQINKSIYRTENRITWLLKTLRSVEDICETYGSH